jgi:hypothetical protein
MLENIFNRMFGKKILGIPHLWKKSGDEDFNFDLIEHYFKRKNHGGKYQIMNERIMNDIDFQELFMYMDK